MSLLGMLGSARVGEKLEGSQGPPFVSSCGVSCFLIDWGVYGLEV